VYLISDRDGEFAQVRYVNLFTGEKTVISAHLPWDVEELAISRDGHYLAFASNEAGAGKLNLLDLRTHQDLIAPKLPETGIIASLSFDADGKRSPSALQRRTSRETPTFSTSPRIAWRPGRTVKRARSMSQSSSHRA